MYETNKRITTTKLNNTDFVIHAKIENEDTESSAYNVTSYTITINKFYPSKIALMISYSTSEYDDSEYHVYETEELIKKLKQEAKEKREMIKQAKELEEEGIDWEIVNMMEQDGEDTRVYDIADNEDLQEYEEEYAEMLETLAEYLEELVDAGNAAGGILEKYV